MKAYIIHLPDREFSNAHASAMLKELTCFGFDAELFVGTNGEDAPKKVLWPYSIKTNELSIEDSEELLTQYVPETFLKDYNVKLTRRNHWHHDEIIKVTRPGVQGCFDSHYRLWRHCIELNEPIAIFEDDVKFFRGYDPIDFDDVLILSIGKTTWKNEPYKTFLESPSSTPRPMSWKNYSMPGTSGYVIMPHACRRLVKTYKDYYLPVDNAINKSLVNIQIHNYLMGRHMHETEGNVSAL